MFMGFIMIIFIRKLNEMKFSRPLSPLSSHLLQHDFAKKKKTVWIVTIEMCLVMLPITSTWMLPFPVREPVALPSHKWAIIVPAQPAFSTTPQSAANSYAYAGYFRFCNVSSL